MKTKIFGILVGLAAFAVAFYLVIVILTGNYDLLVKIIFGLVVMACVYGSFLSFSSISLLESNPSMLLIIKEEDLGHKDRLSKFFSPFDMMLHQPHPWSVDEIKEILLECNKAEHYAWIHSIVTAFVQIPEVYKNKNAGYEYTLSSEVLDLVSSELHKAVDSLLANEEMDKREKDMQIQWTYLFLSPPWGIVEDTEERKALSKKLKNKSKELFPNAIKILRNRSFNDFEWEVGIFGHWG